ncbi:DgyrCDS9823 [Dimorphilus gyrociliatus]|uniref:DgyrCDS9823 n=1 Tax=Dimorphilus gyrociliatus TaxID=2664684 RepID=A0A7I8VZJ2_9ANNE|nr:DgyrCDS9823 [Dimorphilus gyrociliatus]
MKGSALFLVFSAICLAVNATSHPSLSDPLFTKTKYFKLSLICDKACYLTLKLRGNVEDVIRDLVDNEVKPRLGRLNVKTFLVQLELWDKANEFYYIESGSDYLSQLKVYREQHLIPKVWSDATIAITGYRFKGDFSSAFPNSVCSPRIAIGYVKIDTSSSIRTIGSYIAHELGHIFGLDHDYEPSSIPDSQSCCPFGKSNCIMNPSITSTGLENGAWSTCSTDKFVKDLQKPSRKCLWIKPTVVQDSYCGDGVIDAGEECDCGNFGMGFCSNCCDTKECKLKENAQCTEGDCCNDQCQFISAGQVCRNSTNSCDVEDKCSGSNSECPNEVKTDGTECIDTVSVEGYCLKGSCMTLQNECETHWTKDFKASDNCARESLLVGDEFYNCGMNGTIIKTCTEENYKCGRLVCSYTKGNYRDAVDTILNPLYRNIEGESCLVLDKSAWLGGGWQMVSDGVKCGDNKACYKTDCVDKSQAFASIQSQAVAQKTSLCGNGIIEDGEQCDCGAKQCGCCDDSCQLMAHGTTCRSESCRECNGLSQSCSGSYKSSLTKCDGDEGYCVKYTTGISECISHQTSCKALFGELSDVDRGSMTLNNQNNDFFNVGGIYLTNKSSMVVVYREIPNVARSPECGSLKCRVPSGSNARIPGFSALSTAIESSPDNEGRVTKVARFTHTTHPYYTYANYYVMYMYLARTGTPCKTLNTQQPGYCYSNYKRAATYLPKYYPTSVCIAV